MLGERPASVASAAYPVVQEVLHREAWVASAACLVVQEVLHREAWVAWVEVREA